MTNLNSSGAWEPNESVLRELAGYLRDALSAHNPVAQKHATLVRCEEKVHLYLDSTDR